MLLIGLTVAAWLVLRAVPAPPMLRDAVQVLLLLQLAQGVIGFTQYFSGLPVAVVALLFAGLYITDREMRRSEQDRLSADAHDAAAAASTFLLVQAEALSALNGIFVDGVARPSAARMRAVVAGDTQLPSVRATGAPKTAVGVA